MMFFAQCRRGAVGFTLMLAAGCGSQNDSITTPVVSSTSTAPAGVYEGTWTSASTGTSTDVTAFVDSDDKMMLFDDTGALIASGAYSTVESASSISWTARLFETSSSTTTITTLSGEGSYEKGSTILMTLTLSTGVTGVLSLTYDEDAYETKSDVTLIEGTWGIEDAYDATTLSLTVSSDGTFSGTDEDDCTYSGTFSIIDQAYNLYEVSLTTTCDSSSTSTTTTGLATLQAATTTAGDDTLVMVTASTSAAELLLLTPQ
ncbi:MAG: hypothetical protein QM661_13370 [Solimonas sp.]